jgi:hypothetical protein
VLIVLPIYVSIPETMQFRQIIATTILIAIGFIAGIIARAVPGLGALLSVDHGLLNRIPAYVLVRGLTARMAGARRAMCLLSGSYRWAMGS